MRMLGSAQRGTGAVVQRAVLRDVAQQDGSSSPGLKEASKTWKSALASIFGATKLVEGKRRKLGSARFFERSRRHGCSSPLHLGSHASSLFIISSSLDHTVHLSKSRS